MNRVFSEEQLRRIFVAPDPRPRDLGSYRIFTNGDEDDGELYLAARKDGDQIVVIAECDDFQAAMTAVLEDAGMPIKVAFRRSMGRRPPSYEPKASDWA